MTYKQAAHFDEEYPRPMNEGDRTLDTDGRAGVVSETIYLSQSKLWQITVSFENGEEPVSFTKEVPYITIFESCEIVGDLFDGHVGEGGRDMLPNYESMREDYKGKLQQLQANLESSYEELGYLKQSKATWDTFFDERFSHINKLEHLNAMSDEFVSWYQGDAPTPLQPRPMLPVSPPIPVIEAPFFKLDPVVSSNYPAAYLAWLTKAKPIALLPNGLVLLQLRFGDELPPTHSVPCCVARLPADFPSTNFPSMISFTVWEYRTQPAKPGVTGKWRPVVAPLVAPRECIVLSTGIEFTQNGSLTAVSIRNIDRFVRPEVYQMTI